MKLTERQKMMAVSAHANNELREWLYCHCDSDFYPRDRACLCCITGQRAFVTGEEVYHPGMTIGQVVRWLDSL